MSRSFRSTGLDRWASPRPTSDPGQRRYHHGKIQPMKEDRNLSWRFYAFLLACMALVAAVTIEGVGALLEEVETSE